MVAAPRFTGATGTASGGLIALALTCAAKECGGVDSSNAWETVAASEAKPISPKKERKEEPAVGGGGS